MYVEDLDGDDEVTEEADLQKWAALADELAELNRERTPEEVQTAFEDMTLRAKIHSLAVNKPVFGDGSIFPTQTAEEILRVIHRQLTHDQLSAEARAWLAIAIGRYLDGEKNSLDTAFRVKRERGKPVKDPADDADIVHEFVRSLESGLPEKESLRAAYRLSLRKRGSEGAIDLMDTRDVDKRIDDTIIPILVEWGYYRRPSADKASR